MECPDVDSTKPILDNLGPGGIIGNGLDTFDLEILNPGGSVEYMNTRVVCACDFSKLFKASAHGVFSFPLVFNRGASSRLALFKSDFLTGYKSVNVDLKGVT